MLKIISTINTRRTLSDFLPYSTSIENSFWISYFKKHNIIFKHWYMDINAQWLCYLTFILLNLLFYWLPIKYGNLIVNNIWPKKEGIRQFYWWLVRVTLVVDWLYLPQNFGPIVGTYEGLLTCCECTWDGGSICRWWGHLTTVGSNQTFSCCRWLGP